MTEVHPDTRMKPIEFFRLLQSVIPVTLERRCDYFLRKPVLRHCARHAGYPHKTRPLFLSRCSCFLNRCSKIAFNFSHFVFFPKTQFSCTRMKLIGWTTSTERGVG